MKKEIRINHFHEVLSSLINHPERELKYSEKHDALISVNWGWRAVRAISGSKKLAQDILTTEKIIQMRNELKNKNAPFARLGQASYDFSSPGLAILDRRIRCVEQEVVVSSQSLGSKGYSPETKFMYSWGATGNFEPFENWQAAAQIFYDLPPKPAEHWDC